MLDRVLQVLIYPRQNTMKDLAPQILPPSSEMPSLLPTNEKTQLADHLASAFRSGVNTSLLLRTKKTPAGNQTFALTTKGKETAKAVFSQLQADGNAVQIQTETQVIRAEINQELKDIKKEKRAALTSEWATVGIKKRGNMEQFNRELKLRLLSDKKVQEAQLTRKILSSVIQQARSAATKEARVMTRASLTDEQRQTVLQTLVAEGKKVPASTALQDTLVTAWLMRHQEQQEVVEAPKGEVLKETKEPEKTKVKETAEATRRAEIAVPRIKLRSETHRQTQAARITETKKGLAWRWQHAPVDIITHLKGIKQKGLIAASALLAFSSLSATGANLSTANTAEALASPTPATTEMAKAPPAGYAIVMDQAPKAPSPAEKAAIIDPIATAQASMEEVAKEYEKKNINIAVSVRNIATGEQVLRVNPDKVDVAASTAKIYTGAAVLDAVAKGELKLTDSIGGTTLQEQLRLMINRSDNAASDRLRNRLGTERIQNFARIHGAKNFSIDKNTTTPDDLATFLQNLYTGDVLPPEQKNLMLSWMKAGTTSNESLLTPSMGNNGLLHKWGLFGTVVADTGITTINGTPYAVAVVAGGKSFMTDAFAVTDPQGMANRIQAIQTIGPVLVKGLGNEPKNIQS